MNSPGGAYTRRLGWHRQYLPSRTRPTGFAWGRRLSHLIRRGPAYFAAPPGALHEQGRAPPFSLPEVAAFALPSAPRARLYGAFTRSLPRERCAGSAGVRPWTPRWGGRTFGLGYD